VLRKELSNVTQKVEFLDRYLNLDVVDNESDAKKLFDYLEKMRFEKELLARSEAHYEDRAFYCGYHSLTFKAQKWKMR
jgi:hypothetical protein